MDVTVLLLDTHAFVWAVTDPARLSPAARGAVSSTANQLVVSAATPWEMAIKHRAGRWPEAGYLLAQHDDVLARLGASSLDVTSAAAIRAGGLAWEHTDPFDRMLAAQALLSHATLVTRDAAFRDLGGLSLLW